MATTPAGNLTSTSTLGHLATVYYDLRSLDKVRKVFRFMMGTEPKSLPRKKGKTVQWYRFSDFGANTTAQTEGDPGTSLQLTSSNLSATVSQYSDFLSISDMLEDTAINDMVSEAVDALSYRAGLTVDELVKTEVDSVAASVDEALIGPKFSALDAANVRHVLQGVDIEPRSNGYFLALIHPYISYDLRVDPAAGGWQDLIKHDASTQNNSSNFTLPDRGFIGRIHGVEFYESTNVTKTGSSWRTYIFGKGGVGAVDLEGRGPSRIVDPKMERFRVNVIRTSGNPMDPAGLISAYASYKFVFVTKILDTTNYRFRKVDSTSTIAS